MCKRVYLLAFIAGAVAVTASVTRAKELTVGPSKAFSRIENALAKAAKGDTILVYPLKNGKPYEKVALYVTTGNVTIKAVPARAGERVGISGKGFDYSGRGRIPRAIVQFNPGADGCVLEGFDLAGAHNDSHNGAGVRINQANDVTVRNCHIHGNDMGVMSNGDGTEKTAVNQMIEGCLIESNGDLEEPGQNHNLYLGGTSVTLLACEVRKSLTGHNVKSRAHQTLVLACYVHDSANRELDLVDGKGDTTVPDSNAYLVGNVIAKDPKCEGNRAVIHFGADGGKEHDGTLYLVNNTIVTPFMSPVVTLSAPKARACMVNNIVWDGGVRQNGQKLVELAKNVQKDKTTVQGRCNWVSSNFRGLDARDLKQTFTASAGEAPPFVDAAKGDYNLPKSVRQSDAAGRHIIAAGAKWDSLFTAPKGCKLYQYKPPQSKADRTDTAKPDLGAHQHLDK